MLLVFLPGGLPIVALAGAIVELVGSGEMALSHLMAMNLLWMEAREVGMEETAARVITGKKTMPMILAALAGAEEEEGEGEGAEVDGATMEVESAEEAGMKDAIVVVVGEVAMLAAVVGEEAAATAAAVMVAGLGAKTGATTKKVGTGEVVLLPPAMRNQQGPAAATMVGVAGEKLQMIMLEPAGVLKKVTGAVKVRERVVRLLVMVVIGELLFG